MRADLFLVEHGFATTRSQAQRLIASSVQWRVDEGVAWKRVAKNGDEIPDAAEVQVLDSTEAKYISRGGLKLEGALQSTGVDVKGLRCLDVGQSTGGFTDCLLQHGALEVVGVDVGHGQLHSSLREDARVLCLEGINARSLTATELIAARARSLWAAGQSDEENESESGFDAALEADDGLNPVFDFLTGDLSFISLTLVLPAVVRLLKADGDLLMLVKPQFELQPGQVGKGGIVREPALFAFVEKRLRDTCAALGLEVLDWLESPIAGGDGNREFFIHARKGHHVAGEDKPLAPAPARNLPKRTPRSETRALHAAHEDSEEAHAGQHGPARRKQRD
ncbi:TlyA family RNA methyltransferase [Polaromonas sp.]|jgi:23S rRNA (cytidine1920-2'-O)/16S rRNA (cytidine1409-2'-O)-methyltransferase|uniref:TlyA family RNA methyltransferase n=1 Tax=Polaromonas sp. TaxID=1869339 RepID=UPI002C34A431|nr:TlyA family RNA methyltransferase [Polaromonas sp.]HQS30797.1 TlyA family RNA methyltransferase [Polaromonas sp.]HQS91126.1 TlyA family RNA methyltransferase [Polaromonas sp.]